MPTESEKNQFRKLIGDFGRSQVDDSTIDSYLNDATFELTSDFTDENLDPAPVEDFDDLVTQYKPEVIYYAAINWWWNTASLYVNHHSQSVGQSSHQASEKWERAMRMIELLTTKFSEIQTLGTDITIGNLSHFSKNTLQRYGGIREEDSVERF